MTTQSVKPKKPYKDFPLFPHDTGRWAKKIREKQQYFGPWNDADAALKKYLTQRDELQAGRTPRRASDGLTARDLVNRFLTAKQDLVDTHEWMPRTFRDDHTTCELIIDDFGKSLAVSVVQTADFEKLRAKFAKTRGLVSITKYGAPFVRINEKGTVIDAVGLEFGKLLREFKLKRMRLNFYALRHTFETIAGDSRDQVAVTQFVHPNSCHVFATRLEPE